MSAFQFKLEPVLKQRKQVEDRAQRELAQLLRHQMILEEQLRGMQQTISQNKQSLSSSLEQHVDVDTVRRHGVFVNQTRANAQQIVIQMLALNRQVEQARSQLQQAMRQRKAIELLREKQFNQWKAAQQKHEAIELDEISTQQYIRKQFEGVIS